MEQQQEVDAFREAFELPDLEGAEAAAAGTAAKRQKTAGSSSGAAAKKDKPAQPSTLAEWRAAQLDGRLAALTNPILKGFCSEHGLPVGGKKDDLLQRVVAYLDTLPGDAGAGDAA